ncbi:hypothetical protein [Paenibacillus sp. CMAA1364]
MNDYIVSHGEIIRLKQYIEQKHSGLESKQRAPILADAVHRIMENRLPSFPVLVKKRVCSELLAKHRKSLVIQVDDVLTHCMSLDLDEEALMSPLVQWVSSKLDYSVEEAVVRSKLLRWSQQAIPTDAISVRDLVREYEQEELSGYKQLADSNERIAITNKQEVVSNNHMVIASEPIAIAIESMTISSMAIAATNEPVVMISESVAMDSDSIGAYWNKEWFNRNNSIMLACLCAILLLSILILPLDRQSSVTVLQAGNIDEASLQQRNENIKKKHTDGIPNEFRYVSIDTTRLQKYLSGKNSMLAEEPYLSAIVEASKQFNIHPLLLFAITGQEQGFVPKDHKKSKEIVNNPFNVFGSWENYNTTIESSATIAAKTVFNISGRRTGDHHPIQWLNQTYAEDPNWWKGVTWFFNDMLQQIQDDSFEWSQE